MNLFDYCGLHQLFYFIVAFYHNQLICVSINHRIRTECSTLFGAVLDETTGYIVTVLTASP